MIEHILAGWNDVETGFNQQKQAIQRSRDGLVVSIEKNTSGTDTWSAVTLPENFRDDNQIIDSIISSDSRAEVELNAMLFMLEPDT